MSTHVIRLGRGLDVPLAGAPLPEVVDLRASSSFAFECSDWPGTRLRPLVREGDEVRPGMPIVRDKVREGLCWASPVGGRVRSVILGPRRTLLRVVVDPMPVDGTETFPRWSERDLLAADRGAVLDVLLRSGYFALFRRRPFADIPHPTTVPRDIFVNAMSTAPFLADWRAVVRGREAALRVGLAALRALTPGRVFVCVHAEALAELGRLTDGLQVALRAFAGPHPAGNSSVHIHHVAPVRPGEEVWTIRLAAVVLMGELLSSGRVPTETVVAIGGPGIRAEHARHYRVPIGAEVAALLRGRLAPGEMRVVCGDALGGVQLAADAYLPIHAESLTVLPEDRERHLLGWLSPGWSTYSDSRTFLSRWFARGRRWALGTNLHGSPRPMVVTGLYERYLPMRIMPEFLIRAILARDWEEAIQLGLLELAPEDFALCAFACPSKMDLVGIVRAGLEQLQAEGV